MTVGTFGAPVMRRSVTHMSTTALSGARHVGLDVARGIAILGTLATNIWIFSASAAGEKSLTMEALFGNVNFTLAREVGSNPSVDAVINAVLHLITDGKFLGLLTIMFGIGLEIQRQSAERRGQRWPGGYYWRAGLLAVEGLINYIFVFEFDVLMGYGLTALAVAPILARSERVQKIFMWVALTVHVGAIVVLDALLTFFSSAMSDGGQDAPEDMMQLGVPTDNYWAMVQHRVSHFVEGRLEIPIMFMMGLGIFIIGARLYRAGLFDPARADLRRKVLIVGLGFGLPLDWGLRLFATSAAAMTTRYVTSAIVAFGVLALIAAFYVRRGNRLGAVGKAFANVGRTALSCYILQNIIASIVFYDFGLGLARVTSGEGQTLPVLGIYALICLGLMAASSLWLHRFSRGPVEIVMHRLVDKLQAIRPARS